MKTENGQIDRGYDNINMLCGLEQVFKMLMVL